MSNSSSTFTNTPVSKRVSEAEAALATATTGFAAVAWGAVRPAGVLLFLLTLVGCLGKDAETESAQTAPGDANRAGESASSAAVNEIERDGGIQPDGGAEADSDELLFPSDWTRQIAAIEAEETPVFRTEIPATARLIERLHSLDGKLMDVLLDGGGLRGADLGTLAKIQSLFHLRIRVDKLTDAGLQELVHPDSKIEILNLPAAEVTEVGLKSLAELPRLRQLRLGGSQIDDRAMSVLAKMDSLRSLHLIGPRISAVGLKRLEAATGLSSLYIDDCQLPDAAWESMFAAKPGLHVHIDQHHHDRDPNADPH